MANGSQGASQDWAVVVGISNYPELTPLGGPENDANAFYAWVTSPTGGGVPQERARLVLSSAYPGPFEEGEAEPTVAEVERRLNELLRLAARNQADQKGFRVGRRLYLYFSGHGCAPSFEEAAVLMANASRLIVYHLTGKPTADWFFLRNVFDEVVLIMDCCRERYEKGFTAYAPPWAANQTMPGVIDRGRRFYAYATKWSKKAREKPYPPDGGKVRGMFSVALLDALKGAAYDPETVRTDPATGKLVADVTARSLRNYLINFTLTYLTPADLADEELGAVPDIEYAEDPGRPFAFVTVDAPVFAVTFQIPPAAIGKTLTILELHADNTRTEVKTLVAATSEVRVDLPRNFFIASLADTAFSIPFAVNAAPGVANVVRFA